MRFILGWIVVSDRAVPIRHVISFRNHRQREQSLNRDPLGARERFFPSPTMSASGRGGSSLCVCISAQNEHHLCTAVDAYLFVIYLTVRPLRTYYTFLCTVQYLVQFNSILINLRTLPHLPFSFPSRPKAKKKEESVAQPNMNPHRNSCSKSQPPLTVHLAATESLEHTQPRYHHHHHRRHASVTLHTYLQYIHRLSPAIKMITTQHLYCL